MWSCTSRVRFHGLKGHPVSHGAAPSSTSWASLGQARQRGCHERVGQDVWTGKHRVLSQVCPPKRIAMGHYLQTLTSCLWGKSSCVVSCMLHDSSPARRLDWLDANAFQLDLVAATRFLCEAQRVHSHVLHASQRVSSSYMRTRNLVALGSQALR